MKNKTMLLLLLSLSPLTILAQKKTKSWKVNDYGLSYKLPDEWRSDQFNGSSVCECQGTINDNSEWDSSYLGMVVYPSETSIKDSAKQKMVWTYEFKSDETGEEVTVAGITFLKKEGSLNDDKEKNKAWQFISTDIPKEGEAYLIIYFWGKDEQFRKNETVFMEIMNTLKRTKI